MAGDMSVSRRAHGHAVKKGGTADSIGLFVLNGFIKPVKDFFYLNYGGKRDEAVDRIG